MLSVIVYKVAVLEVLVYKFLQDLAFARIFKQGLRRIKDERRRLRRQELLPFPENCRSVLRRQIHGCRSLSDSLKTPLFSVRVYDRLRLWCSA